MSSSEAGVEEEAEEEATTAATSEAPGQTSQRLFQDSPTPFSSAPLDELQTSEVGPSHLDELTSPEPTQDGSLESLDAASPLSQSANHVFILSDAGKPIFVRHGREEDFVVEMCALQALLSTVVDRGEALESFTFGRWRFVFLERSPLILVAVSRGGESEAQLRAGLSLLYHQILSVLTKRQLNRIFEQRRNFDLRRLLSGTEKSLEALSDAWGVEASLVLGAVAPLPLPPQLRDGLSVALRSICSKIPKLLFGLIVGGGQLVTMVRMAKYSLSPGDLHLILSLVRLNGAAFMTAESWLPLCLPRFDSSGFLHAHISHLPSAAEDASSRLFLVLISAEREDFFPLSQARLKIMDKINKSNKPPNLLPSLAQAAELPNQGVLLSEVGLPLATPLWHFVYKNRSSGQMCSAAWEAPYATQTEQRRLAQQYLRLVHHVARPSTPPASPSNEGSPPVSSSSSAAFRILFSVGQREALLAWVTGNFELYAALSPLVSKAGAISRVDKLMKWLKREEERLFILNPLVF